MVKATLLLHFFDDDGVFMAQRLKPVEIPSVEGLQELLAQLEEVSEKTALMQPPFMTLLPQSRDVEVVKSILREIFLVANPDSDDLASVRVMQVLAYDLSKLG